MENIFLWKIGDMVEETVRSEQNSNAFLSYYNDIDKYFTKLLELDKYVPFTERVAAIVAGTFPVSAFVKHVEDKLRYFGDLRNQLVHGFRLDHRHYLLVSDHAIAEIKRIWEELKAPTSLVTIFGWETVRCHENERLSVVLARMKQQQKSHLPVYSAQDVFLGMLSESTIAYRLADVIGETEDMAVRKDVMIGDIHLANTNDRYVFVAESLSVYEVDALFWQEKEHQKRLGAVCVTQTWSQDEEIRCVITALDLPKINAYMRVSF